MDLNLPVYHFFRIQPLAFLRPADNSAALLVRGNFAQTPVFDVAGYALAR